MQHYPETIVKRLDITRISTEGCLNLLEAFLTELMEDYKYIYRDYLNDKNNKKLRGSYEKYRNLFLSDYFAALTGLDGASVLESLDRRLCG